MSYEKSLSVAADIESWTVDEVKELAVATLSAVTIPTPVRDGHARYNWHVTIGQPDNICFTYTGGANGAAQAAIRRGESEVASLKGYNTVYVQNNLPYIERLNDGYSAQAPRNYVDVAIRQVSDAYKG